MTHTLPCDVCGSKPVIEDLFAMWRIACPSGAKEGGKFECALRFINTGGSKEDAIKVWNKTIECIKGDDATMPKQENYRSQPPRTNRTPILSFCRSSVLNVLRILNSIDKHELVAAGVYEADIDKRWEGFRDDPHKSFMRMGDDDAAKLWTIILGRMHN